MTCQSWELTNTIQFLYWLLWIVPFVVWAGTQKRGKK